MNLGKRTKRGRARCFIFVAGTLNIVEGILWRCSEAIANSVAIKIMQFSVSGSQYLQERQLFSVNLPFTSKDTLRCAASEQWHQEDLIQTERLTFTLPYLR